MWKHLDFYRKIVLKMRQLLIIKTKTVVQNRQLGQYISWLSNEYFLYRYSNNSEICI